MRALAIDSMKRSQNITFKEVEFRPCQTTSDGLSKHNWWMDASEPNVETTETGTETSVAVVSERSRRTDRGKSSKAKMDSKGK